MTIVSDIDGVLASFESAWEPLLAKLAGESRLPAGWKTDPNFPDIWDWDKRAYGDDIVREAWKIANADPKFWLKLDPLPGTTEAAKVINTIQRKHQIIFLTRRSGVAAQRQTCEWLYGVGINYPNVITVNDADEKVPILQNLRARFFIDDRLETMEAWYTHCHMNGISTNPPNYFALIDAPYNHEGRTIKGMKVAANIVDALKESGLWT